MATKSDQAFRTIGELAGELGIPQHILRYWETRFPQLRPLQRAGNRRYYRPADVALARRIHRLLNQEGYTIRGVQRVLEEKDPGFPPPEGIPAPSPAPAAAPPAPRDQGQQLRALRKLLSEALAQAAA
jgi:DNA-binding transcriptional MerR regulator